MNRASMLKSRIPDTHYRSRVRRWNTRHGEKETDMERQSVCERERFIFCGANIALHIEDYCIVQQTVNVSSVKSLKGLDAEKGLRTACALESCE